MGSFGMRTPARETRHTQGLALDADVRLHSQMGYRQRRVQILHVGSETQACQRPSAAQVQRAIWRATLKQ